MPHNLKPAFISTSSSSSFETELHQRGNGHGQNRQTTQQHRRGTNPVEARVKNNKQHAEELGQLEAFRRDMLRAKLGATIAQAGSLGPEWRAPRAHIIGTDEDNARRVATLGASEATRVLVGGAGYEARSSAGAGRGRKKTLCLSSGPVGGARAQRRAAAEADRALRGDRPPVL